MKLLFFFLCQGDFQNLFHTVFPDYTWYSRRNTLFSIFSFKENGYRKDPLFIMHDCSCNIAEYGTDSKFCTAFSFYDVKSTDLILRTDLIKIYFIPVFRMNA